MAKVGYNKAHIERVLRESYGAFLIEEYYGCPFHSKKGHIYSLLNVDGDVLANHVTLRELADDLKAVGLY